jgi:hypothetical protein
MSTNTIRWLYRELPGLVEHGVLTDQTADSLREHYGPVPELGGRRVLLLVFSVLGALLIGSGIILLLAHNWDDLSRPARAALSIGLLLAGQAVALWAGHKRSSSPAWTEGSATFLSLAIVACISLLSQTYSMGLALEDVIFMWVVLTLPAVYLLRSRVAAALCWIGATWWLMLGPWPEPPMSHYWYYLGFVALALPQLIWLHLMHRYEPRSALVGWAVCGSLAVALIRPSVWPQIMLAAPLYAGLLGSFYAIGAWRTWNRGDGVAAWRRPFHIFGAVGLAVLLVVCSFEEVWKLSWSWDAATRGYLPLIVTLGLASVLSLLSIAAGVRLLRRGHYEQGLLACAPLVATAGWLLGFDERYSLAIMLAVNLFALTAGLMVCVRAIGRGALGAANGGLLLVLAVLTVRFFDAEISFVARGTGFILLGAGLLAMNAWMLHRRREVQP